MSFLRYEERKLEKLKQSWNVFFKKKSQSYEIKLDGQGKIKAEEILLIDGKNTNHLGINSLILVVSFASCR